MADIYNLERFKQAQDLGVYDQALEEVRNGRKTGHWIWFIFPQLRGFGSSYNILTSTASPVQMKRGLISQTPS